MRRVIISCVLAAACAGVAPAAFGQQKKTSTYSVPVEGHLSSAQGTPLDATLTFSEPVQLPRIKLPAGTYNFMLVSPGTIRVTSEDRTQVLATFSTLPVSRTSDIEAPLVRFEHTSGTAGPKVIALFPEHSSVGWEPVYPSARKQENAPVATTGVKR